jgi:hypothetical protein
MSARFLGAVSATLIPRKRFFAGKVYFSGYKTFRAIFFHRKLSPRKKRNGRKG